MRLAFIRPGQVWEDRDPRRPGRRIRVSAVMTVDGTAYGFLDAVVVAHALKPHVVGRATRIAVACLPEYYRLLPGPCDACGAEGETHSETCPWGQEARPRHG